MSAIYLPDGNDALKKPEPKQSAIVVQTPDGEHMAFPQVAVAMANPDVINLIAQAVVNLLKRGDVLQPDGTFSEGDPQTVPVSAIVEGKIQ